MAPARAAHAARAAVGRAWAPGAPDPNAARRDFRVDVDFRGVLPKYGFTIYDPVIHRVDLVKLSRQVEDFLRAELSRAANRGTPKRPH